VTLAGCSDGSASQTSPAARTSDHARAASSARADPQAAGKAAVLDAYKRFWEEQVKAYTKADTAGTDLHQYATALALSRTESDLKDLRAKGIVTTGAPTHDATVNSFQPEKKVPYAKLRDCLDSTDWKFVYRKSNKPVEMPKKRLVRYVTEIEAEKWGKQWKIVDVTPQQRAC
jgi:hypothetical protein